MEDFHNLRRLTNGKIEAPNENKLSRGERERAWLLPEGLRSCKSGYRAGSPSAAALG